ncbi:hypothetical protein [Streptomyces sioyaensis]|uniref:ApeA N-terminal domain 1-containing protein n=1 Tax=Streptomyces sioyaensis TaxID=67364 RepID=UPI0036EB5287
MEENDKKVMSGALGYFWENAGSTTEGTPSLNGFFKESDGGTAQVEYFLEESLDPFTQKGMPQSIYGCTAHGRVLVLDIFRRRETIQYGGLPSVRRYSARTAVFGASSSEVDGDKILNVEAFFPGITRWAGMRTIDEGTHHDEESRARSFRLQVTTPERESCPLRGGRVLSLASHWRVGGSSDDRTVYSPVAISCNAKRATAIRELFTPIIHMQDLLNIAYDGFVLARGGRVTFPGNGNPRTHPRLWNSRTMFQPAGVPTPESMTENPLFLLEHLGGISGISRWIKLCEDTPRISRVLSSRFRIGSPGPEARLMEIASAIEYWVALQDRSGVAWAQERRRPLALALRVGKHFTDWVGDAQEWDSIFAGTYNAIKHDPTFAPDPYAVSYLAEAGYLLLLSAILNRVSASKKPSLSIFNSHRNYNLSEAVKALPSDPSAQVKRREQPRRIRKRRPV